MAKHLSSILPLPAVLADNAFAPLAGETLLARVARTMWGTAVVAVAEQLADAARETLAAQSLSTVGVVVAESPGSRAQCLTAGLRYLSGGPRRVLIHDIRRPLAPARLRDRVIAALDAGNSVVMPVLAVTDSVKVVDIRGAVIGTLDRSTLQVVQYPRGFAVDQLADLLAARTLDDFDELEESLRADVPITFVEGDPNAFVVELPGDTAFVEAVIASRRPVDR